MIIKITFDNLESPDTQKTIFQFFGIPNGTCLSSYGASYLNVYSKKVSETGIAFRYLDNEVIRKYYSSWKETLLKFPGVSNIQVLDFDWNREEMSIVELLDNFLPSKLT